MVFYAEDVSECTDAPEGHVCWSAPLDGDARIHHGSREAPLEGLPSTLYDQRALYRIYNNRFQSTPWALDFMVLGLAKDKPVV